MINRRVKMPSFVQSVRLFLVWFSYNALISSSSNLRNHHKQAAKDTLNFLSISKLAGPEDLKIELPNKLIGENQFSAVSHKESYHDQKNGKTAPNFKIPISRGRRLQSSYTVQIPAGVQPGQTFNVQIGGATMALTVPADKKPGDSITFSSPSPQPVPQIQQAAPVPAVAPAVYPVSPAPAATPVAPALAPLAPALAPAVYPVAPAPAPAPAAAPIAPAQTFSINIPAGLMPGQSFNVQVAGKTVPLTVPADKKGGDPFTFSLPADPAPASAPPSASAPAQQFTVQIPAGLMPGQGFSVQVAGKTVPLTVPADKKGGDSYTFNLPSEAPAPAEAPKPQSFTVTIPAGLLPGQSFSVQVAGNTVPLTVPSDKKGGDSYTFSLPGEQQSPSSKQYTVQIPLGVVPGQKFSVQVEGKTLTITVPADKQGGDSMTFSASTPGVEDTEDLFQRNELSMIEQAAAKFREQLLGEPNPNAIADRPAVTIPTPPPTPKPTFENGLDHEKRPVSSGKQSMTNLRCGHVDGRLKCGDYEFDDEPEEIKHEPEPEPEIELTAAEKAGALAPKSRFGGIAPSSSSSSASTTPATPAKSIMAGIQQHTVFVRPQIKITKAPTPQPTHAPTPAPPTPKPTPRFNLPPKGGPEPDQQEYTTLIPDGVMPGQMFTVEIFGMTLSFEVPADKMPGDPYSFYLPADAAQAPPAQQTVQYTTLVPDGVYAGDIFTVTIGDQTITLTVPDDKMPGDVIAFEMAVNEEPQVETAQYTTLIPEGVYPGQIFTVTIGDQTIPLTVPEGKMPGDAITFELPALDMNQPVEENPEWNSITDSMVSLKAKPAVQDIHSASSQRGDVPAPLWWLKLAQTDNSVDAVTKSLVSLKSNYQPIENPITSNKGVVSAPFWWLQLAQNSEEFSSVNPDQLSGDAEFSNADNGLIASDAPLISKAFSTNKDTGDAPGHDLNTEWMYWTKLAEFPNQDVDKDVSDFIEQEQAPPPPPPEILSAANKLEQDPSALLNLATNQVREVAMRENAIAEAKLRQEQEADMWMTNLFAKSNSVQTKVPVEDHSEQELALPPPPPGPPPKSEVPSIEPLDDVAIDELILNGSPIDELRDSEAAIDSEIVQEENNLISTDQPDKEEASKEGEQGVEQIDLPPFGDDISLEVPILNDAPIDDDQVNPSEKEEQDGELSTEHSKDAIPAEHVDESISNELKIDEFADSENFPSTEIAKEENNLITTDQPEQEEGSKEEQQDGELSTEHLNDDIPAEHVDESISNELVIDEFADSEILPSTEIVKEENNLITTDQPEHDEGSKAEQQDGELSTEHSNDDIPAEHVDESIINELIIDEFADSEILPSTEIAKEENNLITTDQPEQDEGSTSEQQALESTEAETEIAPPPPGLPPKAFESTEAETEIAPPPPGLPPKAFESTEAETEIAPPPPGLPPKSPENQWEQHSTGLLDFATNSIREMAMRESELAAEKIRQQLWGDLALFETEPAQVQDAELDPPTENADSTETVSDPFLNDDLLNELTNSEISNPEAFEAERQDTELSTETPTLAPVTVDGSILKNDDPIDELSNSDASSTDAVKKEMNLVPEQPDREKASEEEQQDTELSTGIPTLAPVTVDGSVLDNDVPIDELSNSDASSTDAIKEEIPEQPDIEKVSEEEQQDTELSTETPTLAPVTVDGSILNNDVPIDELTNSDLSSTEAVNAEVTLASDQLDREKASEEEHQDAELNTEPATPEAADVDVSSNNASEEEQQTLENNEAETELAPPPPGPPSQTLENNEAETELAPPPPGPPSQSYEAETGVAPPPPGPPPQTLESNEAETGVAPPPPGPPPQTLESSRAEAEIAPPPPGPPPQTFESKEAETEIAPPPPGPPPQSAGAKDWEEKSTGLLDFATSAIREMAMRESEMAAEKVRQQLWGGSVPSEETDLLEMKASSKQEAEISTPPSKKNPSENGKMGEFDKRKEQSTGASKQDLGLLDFATQAVREMAKKEAEMAAEKIRQQLWGGNSPMSNQDLFEALAEITAGQGQVSEKAAEKIRQQLVDGNSPMSSQELFEVLVEFQALSKFQALAEISTPEKEQAPPPADQVNTAEPEQVPEPKINSDEPSLEQASEEEERVTTTDDHDQPLFHSLPMFWEIKDQKNFPTDKTKSKEEVLSISARGIQSALEDENARRNASVFPSALYMFFSHVFKTPLAFFSLVCFATALYVFILKQRHRARFQSITCYTDLDLENDHINVEEPFRLGPTTYDAV